VISVIILVSSQCSQRAFEPAHRAKKASLLSFRTSVSLVVLRRKIRGRPQTNSNYELDF
jgi:hypothetical protein